MTIIRLVNSTIRFYVQYINFHVHIALRSCPSVITHVLIHFVLMEIPFVMVKLLLRLYPLESVLRGATYKITMCNRERGQARLVMGTGKTRHGDRQDSSWGQARFVIGK